MKTSDSPTRTILMPTCDTTPQEIRSAIVITIDGLGARYLGAYGNDWRQTPNLDRWAAAGLLLEIAITDQPGQWLDRIPLLQPTSPSANSPNFERNADTVSQRWRRILITDDPQVAASAETKFDEVQLVELTAADEGATDWTETQTAMFFANAAAAVESMTGPQLLWIHSRGFQNDWDAPQDWRQDLMGDDDPEPPEWTIPPLKEQNQQVDSNTDPDTRWGWLQCYGAQLRVIDQCLGMLFELIEARWLAGEALLALFYSTRGYPLGEHGVFGHEVATVFDEVLHVPLILRDHSGLMLGQRRLSLANVRDAFDWVCDWSCGDSQTLLQRWPILPDLTESTIVGSAGEWHFVRTMNWKWIGQSNRDQLFSKPDDRWEQNDVSDRCPDVVADLRQRCSLLADDVG